MCRWPLRAPAPLWSNLWPIIDPIFVTFREICNFRGPTLVTFYFFRIDPFFRLNEEHFTFHLPYKHSATFANRKYEELFSLICLLRNGHAGPIIYKHVFPPETLALPLGIERSI